MLFLIFFFLCPWLLLSVFDSKRTDCKWYLFAMKQKFGPQHSLRTFKMPEVFKLHRYSPFSLPLPTFSHRVISVVVSPSPFEVTVHLWADWFTSKLPYFFGLGRGGVSSFFSWYFNNISFFFQYMFPRIFYEILKLPVQVVPVFVLAQVSAICHWESPIFFPSVSQAMLLNCTLTVKLRFIHLHLISFSTLRPLLSLYQVISDFQIGVRGRLRARILSSEHAHFENFRPPNQRRVLSTENSYS